MPGIDHLIRTDFKTVDKRDEVRNVLSWLTGDTSKPPIVTDDERPVGIVNDRAMMRRRLDVNAKLDRFMSTTRALTPEERMEEVVRRMVEHRAAYLPVEDKRGLTKGYVRALDVARELDSGGPASQVAVRVMTLREEHTLGDALHAFTQEYVDWLPVLDRDGKVAGALPRSLLIALGTGTGGTRGRKDAGGEAIDLLEMPVGGHMDTGPVTVDRNAPRDEVLEKLERFGYVIVNDAQGRYFGIVTPETLLEGAGSGAPGQVLPAPPTQREPIDTGRYSRHS